jgi:hypothetical protein
MKRTGLIVALLCVLLIASGAAALANWSPAQDPAGHEIWASDGPSACPEVFLIGMRGSGQNGAAAGSLEFGSQVERLYRSYAAEIHGHPLPGSPIGARAAPVPTPGYRAVPVDFFAPGNTLESYYASVAEGAAAIVATMRKAAKRCGPSTRFVLAGFSQGAHAVTRALPDIAPRLRDRVDAVLLVASPVWLGDQDIEYFGFGPGWRGILAGSCDGACGGTIATWATPVTAAMCNDGDLTCSSSGLLPHATYTSDDLGTLAEWGADRTHLDLPIPYCAARRATHVGTRGANVIKGTPYPDVVVAGAGADVIRTYGGLDTICADAGADEVVSGAKRDLVWGGPGGDTIRGGNGNDRIWGEGGADALLEGGGANDVIRGGPGADRIDGGYRHDLLRGGGGDDVITGDRGDDELDGGGGVDRCDGGPGLNTLANCELGLDAPR